ncbi:MAG: DUF2997 domain-containing protein [Cyanobacteriota bacterium]|nr:DUF2997 domain-containing protein [Cyanobacteriota bacterium]
MEQQTIRYRIHPNGHVEQLVEGVKGSSCEPLTEAIEARLGTVLQRQPTPEAYVAAPIRHNASAPIEITAS